MIRKRAELRSKTQDEFNDSLEIIKAVKGSLINNQDSSLKKSSFFTDSIEKPIHGIILSSNKPSSQGQENSIKSRQL